MPLRQEIDISQIAIVSKFSRVFCQSSLCAILFALLCALRCFAVIVISSAVSASAQETQKPPLPTQASPSPAAQPPDGQAPNAPVPPKPVALYNLLQNKSYVFPDIAFSTERLSAGQKFELFVDNSVSVDAFTWSMLGSAVGQADNSPNGFHQGWDGYGKRFGTDMARQASGQFFGTFVIATALHEDPRFYAEINPGFFHAIKYSLQRVFIMRNDDGHEVVAWSKLVGPALGEGLATVYWPDQNRTVGNTFVRYGLDLASRASGNLLREFWPVLLQKMSHPPRPAAGHN
ncbi:MAG: hypothetical protein WCF61_04090 [Terriglobales bacterium]